MTENVQELVRKSPWADITLTVGEDAALTSREMLQAAGLDWEVEKVPAVRRLRDGSIVQWPGHYEVRKTDDEQPLGHVLSVYEPFQNRDAFSFGDLIVADGKGKWVAAGQAYDNLQVIMVMKLTEELAFHDDMHSVYLVLTTTHNASGGLRAMAIPFRLECFNQMGTALDSASWAVSIRHTPSMKDRVIDAAETLQRSYKVGGDYMLQAQRLTKVRLGDEAMMEQVLARALRPGRSEEKDHERRAEIIGLHASSPTLEKWRGTGFGLLNALTEHENHYRKYRTGQARYMAMQATVKESAALARALLAA